MRRVRRVEQLTARHEADFAAPRNKSVPLDTEAQHLRRRKLRVVAAVRGGSLSLHQALQRFGLSLDEFHDWEHEVGEELERQRPKNRDARAKREIAAYERLLEENRALRTENRWLREQINRLRAELSNAPKRPRPRLRPRGDVDRSPE